MAADTFVWVQSDFVGYHCWKEAPEDVRFLRNLHRHLFKVRVMVEVSHQDREVEFFQLKRKLDDELDDWRGEKFEYSCEHIAVVLLKRFDAAQVEVSEDGENGVLVMRREEDDWEEEELESLKKKTTCFVGIEAEGPHRGRSTLFVPGNVSLREVSSALDECGAVECIYYGAGNSRKLRQDTLRWIRDEWIRDKTNHLIVEYTGDVPLGDDDLPFHGNEESVLFGEPDGSDWKYTKKFESGMIVWRDRHGNEWKTPQDDWLFDADTYVKGVPG